MKTKTQIKAGDGSTIHTGQFKIKRTNTTG